MAKKLDIDSTLQDDGPNDRNVSRTEGSGPTSVTPAMQYLPNKPTIAQGWNFVLSSAQPISGALVTVALIGSGLFLSGCFSGLGSDEQPIASPLTKTSLAVAMIDEIDPLTLDEYEDAPLSVLEQHAEAGIANAQYVLAKNLSYGKGKIERDKEAAKIWFQKAASSYWPSADDGDVESQKQLGFLYERGFGVNKDEDEAQKWYRKAAIAGDLEAQKRLAGTYDSVFELHAFDGCNLSAGENDDNLEAIKWYLKAAAAGDLDSKMNLARMYTLGDGVIDGKQVVYWYQKAAEQSEDCSAELKLGKLYEEGLLIKQDLDEAKKWYLKAKAKKSDKHAWLNKQADQRFRFRFGSQMPELSGMDIAGDEFKLSDYRGKVVWLTFYTSY